MRTAYSLVPFLPGSVPDLGLDGPSIAQGDILGGKLDAYCRCRILRQRIVHVLRDETCLTGLGGSDQYYLIKMAFTHINFYLNFLIII